MINIFKSIKHLVFGFVIASVYIVHGEEAIDSFDFWKDVKFEKYCVNSTPYEKFTSILKKDMEKTGLDLKRDSIKVEQYINIRNEWLKKSNFENFLMALVITEQLMYLLASETRVYHYGKLEVPKQFDGERYLNKIRINKQQMFEMLDFYICKEMPNHKRLSALEGKDSPEGQTNGWYKYIKQLNLQYCLYGSASLLSKKGGEDEFILRLWCAYGYVKFPQFSEICVKCAAIVDMPIKIDLMYRIIHEIKLPFTPSIVDSFYINTARVTDKTWLIFSTNNAEDIKALSTDIDCYRETSLVDYNCYSLYPNPCSEHKK